MEVNELCTIIGVNVALFAGMTTLVVWAVNKLDSDVRGIGSRLDGHAQRIDTVYHSSNSKHEAQMARIDQLYQMFVDLLKSREK